MSDVGKEWGTEHYNVSKLQGYDVTPAPFVMEAANLFKETGVKTILDAGCGQGRNLLYLARLGFDVKGVDASKEALSLSDTLLRSNGINNHELFHSKLQDLHEIKDASVDAIISVTVMTHIPDPENVLKEFYRILKPGGHIVCDFATLRDSTYEGISTGKKVGDHAFLDRGLYVQYRDKPEEVSKLFGQFQLKSVKEIKFWEPGHPGSRPEPHMHASFHVVAKKI